jgi:GNAT superfamily N-acetyltransferase
MPDNPIQIRPMEPDEIQTVSELVFRSFRNNVAAYYSEEGAETFFNYTNPKELAERRQKDHFFLVAVRDRQIIGMIEIRNNNHISLLFVEPLRQYQGVGKKLLEKAVAIIRQADPQALSLTVNSSPNSVEAYKRFGFAPTDSFQEKNGIQFLPMMLEIPVGF